MVCLCCERRRGRTQSGREARTVRLAPRSSAASPVTDLSICGNLQTDRRPPNPDSRVFPYFWAYPRCFSFLLICPATERERERRIVGKRLMTGREQLAVLLLSPSKYPLPHPFRYGIRLVSIRMATLKWTDDSFAGAVRFHSSDH